MKSIGMPELQKIFARAIHSLPRPVPIKSGPATIGELHPPPRPDQDGLRRLLANIDKAAAAYTPEETAAIDAIALERCLD